MFNDTIQINQYENRQEVGDTVQNNDALERIVHNVAGVWNVPIPPLSTSFSPRYPPSLEMRMSYLR